jgi:hypothetical protein
VFMNISNVKVQLKSGDVLTGDLMPVEDFREIKHDIPAGQYLELMLQQKTGILLMTNKGLSYLANDEIETMSSLRIF